MPTVNSSGTQSATLGTEHTLATITAAGTYVLTVDAANMAAGDWLELFAKLKVLSASTARVLYSGFFRDVQANPDKVSIPIVVTHSVDLTLRQAQGTVTITTVTGTIAYGSSVTGQTSGATGIVRPLGGGNVAGTSTILQVLTGTFSNGETVQLSAGNSFVLNAAPTGRSFDWEIEAL